MSLLLVVVAWAGTGPVPGGWTATGGLPVRGVALRTAALTDFDGRFYWMGAVRAQTTAGAFGFLAEMPMVAGWGSSGWSQVEPGSLLLGARYFLGRDPFRTALGIEARLPLQAQDEASVFWVSSRTEAAGTSSVAITWDWASGPRAPATGRVALGLGSNADVGDYSLAPIGTGISVAWTSPRLGQTAVVGEVELGFDDPPLAVRALARQHLSAAWTADLGVQVPVALMFQVPVFAPLAQVRGYW